MTANWKLRCNSLNRLGLNYNKNVRFLRAAVECHIIKEVVLSHNIELLNNRNSISFHAWKLFGLGRLRISIQHQTIWLPQKYQNADIFCCHSTFRVFTSHWASWFLCNLRFTPQRPKKRVPHQPNMDLFSALPICLCFCLVLYLANMHRKLAQNYASILEQCYR